MKRWYITAKFPQALAKNTFQTATVLAGSLPLAANRGLKEIMSREGIKGKRHQVVVVTVQRDHEASDQ